MNESGLDFALAFWPSGGDFHRPNRFALHHQYFLLGVRYLNCCA